MIIVSSYYNYFRNKLMNSTTHEVHDYCGVNSNVSMKWQKYFNDIHLGLNHYTIRCLFSELIPTAGVILFNICIMYYLLYASHHLIEDNDTKKSKERKQTTSWMNVILILHSSLFLLSLLSHIVGHFMSVEAHETWWVLLAILANCSLNFYLYCLSGQAFRQHVICFIQQVTMHRFEKLRIRKHRWKQRQNNFQENGLTYNYQLKRRQRSIRINLFYRMSKDNKEESSL